MYHCKRSAKQKKILIAIPKEELLSEKTMDRTHFDVSMESRCSIEDILIPDLSTFHGHWRFAKPVIEPTVMKTFEKDFKTFEYFD